MEVRGRGDRDEALDLRPAHQELHADPGAEGEAGDPAAARVGVHRLHPVERRRGIRQLARAVVELALATPDAAEVEAQHREAALREHVEELVDDLVVHRPAELRVGMEDDGDRAVALLGRLETAFEPAGRAGEDDFGHRKAAPIGSRARMRSSAGLQSYHDRI